MATCLVHGSAHLWSRHDGLDRRLLEGLLGGGGSGRRAVESWPLADGASACTVFKLSVTCGRER